MIIEPTIGLFLTALIYGGLKKKGKDLNTGPLIAVWVVMTAAVLGCFYVFGIHWGSDNEPK